ncbi:DUF2946 domain-containing protein [Ectopseudomonas mendocina]|uniref:DUF2946 domain-containing protein n=1 Tax=Ectopseudomonas mendocina TaxID=300 RepID=A0ABZ2RIA8_ECTME
MKLRQSDRRLLAWMLYFSVLFSALVCSLGHGQMAGLQLSGLDGQYCSTDSNVGAGADLSGPGMAADLAGSGCALSSSFSAVLLISLFGLLGLLPRARSPRLSHWLSPLTAVRYLWPSANPRASPALS